MTSYAPAWQTDELAEEWVDHSTSLPSNGSSSPSSTNSFDSTKFVAGGKAMRIVSGHTTFPSPHHSAPGVHQKRQSSTTYDLESPPTSNHSQSSASGSSLGETSTVPAGTFLVKPEDQVNDDGLKRNPFIGGGGDIGAGDGGSLFQRLELERMFDPPKQVQGEGQDVPLRRTSHSYVPARPSRLSNSMTPSAGDTSVSSSGDGSASMIRHGSQQSQAPHEPAGDSYEHGESSSEDEEYPQHSTRRTTMRRFSGEPGSMRDVEFTFSPSPIRKRPSAQTLVTHTSRSISSDVSPSGGSPRAQGRKPFRLFQRQVDTEGYDSVRSRELIASIVVRGTPLRDLVGRVTGGGSPSPRAGYMHGLRNRVDSGVSGGTTTTGRRRHGQLAKQWSTSSGSAGSGSWMSGDVEERSSKRIRLSESVGSREGYEERAGDDAVYDYSASGSEDAVDQRSMEVSLNASQSRSNKYNHHAQPFPVDASSASEAQEDEAGVKQAQRRSWGEKGQELLDRIRDVGTDKSDSWNSWSRSSHGADGQGEAVQERAPASPPTPPPQCPEPPTQYGTVTSSNSGGTTSSNNTITSRYLSAGITMLEKIKERKVSDSSGTGVCTDGDGRVESRAAREGQYSGRASRPEGSRGLTRQGTASSQSTVRGNPVQQLSQSGFELNGTARSGVSVESSRSSYVASLGKGAPTTDLRPLADSASNDVRVEEPEADQVPRLARSQQENMNRYISSTSTANTATTAISTSFVKHRGPPPPMPHGRAQGVRTIGLNDIPQIPRQVGNMVFDPVRGWVKAKVPVQADREASPMSGEGKSSSAESVDIFAGMESLRDEEGTPQPESEPQLVLPRRRGQNLSPVLEVSMSHIQEETFQPGEVDPTMSSFAPAETMQTALPVRSAPPNRDEQPQPEAHATLRLASLSLEEKPQESEEVPLTKLPETHYGAQGTPERPTIQRPELRECISAPTPLQTDPLQSTPAVRSILKVGSAEMSATKAGKAPATPMSAIKIAVPEDSARRSVSFSDGRTHGKILEHNARVHGATRKQRNWRALAPEDDIFNSQDGSSNGEQSLLPMQPSVRSKRIQNMLTDLSGNASETPSKTSNSGSRKLSLLSEPSPATMTDTVLSESSFHSRVRQARRSKADATFLTECSFGVAHDRLVEVITEVQPYEPHWERLKKIDLSKRGVDSVARLKEFCPDLDEANLDNNQISYLSGLPTSLRRLQVTFNRLTNVSSVDYLANLQYLDVSHNQIDSVNALSCLKHLRELRLDYNQVQDLKDIMGMDSLVKLSCKGNAIKTVDFSCAQWTHMECLDLSRNQISHVEGLETLSSLTTLNLDHNRLTQCTASVEMRSLRALRLSHNQLTTLDTSKFPRLRSLYADSNQIQTLAHSLNQKSVRLEYLSLRDQDVYDLSLSYDHLRDVKRLYISGNHLSSHFFPTRPLFSLVYLEAAACSMSEWPEDFALRLPNLRILNMNYNFLEDLSGLERLQGLRKLMMIGCRLGEERSSSVMRSVRQIGTLEEIDLRMNPLNSNFYLPLMINEASPNTMIYPADASATDSGTHTSLSTDKWAGMDDKFRQLLPDKWYFKRLVYRGALKLACETIGVIDGIQLTHGEMRKAIELMEDAAVKGKTAV